MKRGGKRGMQEADGMHLVLTRFCAWERWAISIVVNVSEMSFIKLPMSQLGRRAGVAAAAREPHMRLRITHPPPLPPKGQQKI